jgi:hypothetical protein
MGVSSKVDSLIRSVVKTSSGHWQGLPLPSRKGPMEGGLVLVDLFDPVESKI